MLIDGRIIAISDEQAWSGREQLELPTDFFLVEATQLLHHHTGSGWVQIPLPQGLLVAAYENPQGHRRYGVVDINKQLNN
ncbi:MAG: hypothetical protein ACRESJ_13805 [Pseudomonas sp.]|uniref:hypothetical protein n=1 Tax=Pseudomonas sp. TaxID=306 RepID=UPI003D6F3724